MHIHCASNIRVFLISICWRRCVLHYARTIDEYKWQVFRLRSHSHHSPSRDFLSGLTEWIVVRYGGATVQDSHLLPYYLLYICKAAPFIFFAKIQGTSDMTRHKKRREKLFPSPSKHHQSCS